MLLAVDQSIASKHIHVSENFEILGLEIRIQFPVVVCVVYVPPGVCYSYIVSLLDSLDCLFTGKSVLLLADFNLPNVNWSTLTGLDNIANVFCDFIFDHGFKQVLNNPIQRKGNMGVLDLVFTSIPEYVHDVRIETDTNPINTDHFPIYLTLQQDVTLIKVGRKSYDYSKTDLHGLNEYTFTLILATV